MKLSTGLVLVFATAMSAWVLADDSAAVVSEAAIAPGMQTQAWLSAQSQGVIASAIPQAAKSIQRDKAAERLMKTYDFPIKESFYGDTFQSGK